MGLLLVVGAVLMLLGQLALPQGGRSALLVSLGAAMGGLPLFWTLVVPSPSRRSSPAASPSLARAPRRPDAPHPARLVARGSRRGGPDAPLEGDTHADVVIVGGGYLGMWTAWHLLELEPELDVVLLETAVCGHGPSGRNGGFCESLWGDAPTLREQAGDAAALAVCRASEDAVPWDRGVVQTNEVDAWFREAPMLRVATTESQMGSWDDIVRTAAELGAPDEVVSVSADEVRARCASPLFSAARSIA